MDEVSFDADRSVDGSELNELRAEPEVFVDDGDIALFDLAVSAGNLSRISRRESLAVGRFWPAGVSMKVGKRIMVAGMEAGTQPRYLHLDISGDPGYLMYRLSERSKSCVSTVSLRNYPIFAACRKATLCYGYSQCKCAE